MRGREGGRNKQRKDNETGEKKWEVKLKQVEGERERMEKETQTAIGVYRHRTSSMGRVGARGEVRVVGYERDFMERTEDADKLEHENQGGMKQRRRCGS